jgi:hypothetical protein
MIRSLFGACSADSIRKNEFAEWLTQQVKHRESAATPRNRWQATFSLIFRVRLDNEKIERNPAARTRKKAAGGSGFYPTPRRSAYGVPSSADSFI